MPDVVNKVQKDGRVQIPKKFEGRYWDRHVAIWEDDQGVLHMQTVKLGE